MHVFIYFIIFYLIKILGLYRGAPLHRPSAQRPLELFVSLLALGVAVASLAVGVALRGVLSGPPSTTRGLVPSTCSPGHSRVPRVGDRYPPGPLKE
jgi:hypothetical protein